MFVRHLISRFHQLFLLGLLLLTLLTTVISLSHNSHQAQAPDNAPLSSDVADGWSDPVGG
ncbi:MAG: hypothetical protein H6658_09810 [Ardenticatenaceae bacterium]|nr:hypothetical protein [Ardenticatenaceae bacterium]